MTQNRIQDWIRYVQENSENITEAATLEADAMEAAAPTLTRETRARTKAPAKAPTRSGNEEKRVVAEEFANGARNAEIRVLETAHTELENGTAVAAPSAQGAVEQTKEPPRTRQRLKPETRAQMLERLNNPTISLHEASVILKVCSATVRRYADTEQLPHVRTEGGQRRFRLREVLALLRTLEAKRKTRPASRRL